MKKIEIDNDIYAYLQSKAIAFEETSPNMTLRRLLGLNDEASVDIAKPQTQKPNNWKKKQIKTNLPLLVKSGFLQEGQKLTLYNYRGEKVPGYEATISGKSLSWNGVLYSMSKLAKIGLKDNKYTSEFVQGPARWFTEDGKSIFQLWSDFLKKIQK